VSDGASSLQRDVERRADQPRVTESDVPITKLRKR
jgi:hypothetical protein